MNKQLVIAKIPQFISSFRADKSFFDDIDYRLSEYIEEVLSNPANHNMYEILSVMRFISFSDKYCFDIGKFNQFKNFYEQLKFPSEKGQMSFLLTPVQIFQFASIYGWSNYAARIQAFPFTQKTYISNEGAPHAWIDLNYIPTVNTEVTVQWAHGGATGNSGWGADIGVMGTDFWRFGANNGANSYWCNMANQTGSTSGIISANWGIDTVTIGNFYLNQTGSTNTWTRVDSHTWTTTMGLFCGKRHNATVPEEYCSRYMRIYDLVIKEGSTEVRHYIPVLDPSNVPALFEMYTCTYFYNGGTGTLITD